MKKIHKAVMLIIDGLGDRPIDEFGGLTPLEAARTPCFDMLARGGITGLMDPLSPGIRVGTDVGHLALFGYNPLKVYWGRGPIEAVGVGINLRPGDVALRCNFATVDENFVIINRRAGRIRNTAPLAAALDNMSLGDGMRAIFKPATEHRAVLVLSGDRLSAEITNSDPGPVSEGEPVREVKPKHPGQPLAEKTARLVNEFVRKSYEILRDHEMNKERLKKGLPPANIVITRGAGMAVKMRSLTERFDIKGCCVTGESTIAGVAQMAGFSVLMNEKLTANIDTDLDEKARLTLEGLKTADLVVTHIKGVDLVAHDHRPREKLAFIEKTDQMLQKIIDGLDDPQDTFVAVTADHSTPCVIGEHSADPVPVLIHGEGVLVDEVRSYGERACARGGLCRIRANDFLLSLLDLMGVTYRFGS
ncbi:MAG: 2,3-bisphosphoglycerate-independent phosphoglycerate mutase [Candidatus Abyssobacteria bacterium SURF_17]|uniref:2,3-bisphosphoglycerate-independent phosphoglycerate mutase n=1 Tax=Candidatus Abyssobacteria bacterium SURF_17 TaxID=2093361 RepID=A0A419F177_9BACT|nr:MAG: 2,3-bisphosphoglycerate-independent phosphoglycerate mutase [Candidatus Abyssubacteria bacterium SURF_17]